MNLEDINTLLLQAEERGDGPTLADLVTEDFTIIRATGVRQNKQEFVAAAGKGRNMGRAMSDFEEIALANAKLVRLKITTQRNPDGTAVTRQFWNTRVFVQADAQWKCTAWQVTEIQVPASPK